MDEPEKEAPPVASVAPPPPKPTVVRERPAVKKPIRLTEDMAKPVMLSGSQPEYPPDVKSQGIEGVVIVRYTIAEDGSVKDVKALKGPPELHAACIEKVKGWRFQPIIVDGSPQAVVRMARFAFRIK
jgi:protein TonB